MYWLSLREIGTMWEYIRSYGQVKRRPLEVAETQKKKLGGKKTFQSLSSSTSTSVRLLQLIARNIVMEGRVIE